MVCRTFRSPDGKALGIVCGPGQRSRRCSSCSALTKTGVLCDFPLAGAKAGKTCSRHCCQSCAVHVGEDRDYCPAHAREAGIRSLRPVSSCKGCGAQVAWKVTTKGGKMPIDPEPVPDGNIVLNDAGFAVVLDRERIAKLEARPDRERWPRYVSHFATCAHAREFRKKKESKK